MSYDSRETDGAKVSVIFVAALLVIVCLTLFCTGCVSEPTRVAAIKLEKQLRRLKRASVPHPDYTGKPEQLKAYGEAWDEAFTTNNAIIEANGGRDE